MDSAGVAGYVQRWRPSSVSPRAADFARTVVSEAGPGGQERAKNLLWAAGKLADWGIGLGLDPVPPVLLHPSVIERFTASAPGDAPLPRERSKAPCRAAEITGYLALADADRSAARTARRAR